MIQVINFYTVYGRYGFLSNFFRAYEILPFHNILAEIKGNEVLFSTNEHYYQHMKAKHEVTAKWIAQAPTPYLAMKAGRSLRRGDLRDGWDEMKDEVMLTGLRAKFSQNPRLKDMLLDTGDAIIHENSPYDMYWGVRGKDRLGQLLIQVREELRGV